MKAAGSKRHQYHKCCEGQKVYIFHIIAFKSVKYKSKFCRKILSGSKQLFLKSQAIKKYSPTYVPLKQKNILNKIVLLLATQKTCHTKCRWEVWILRSDCIYPHRFYYSFVEKSTRQKIRYKIQNMHCDWFYSILTMFGNILVAIKTDYLLNYSG